MGNPDLRSAAERVEITDAMLEAAMRAGPLSRENARRVLSAGLSRAATVERGARYPLWVNTTLDTKRARFMGATDRRGYFRVQTEDGKDLTIHANEIQTTKGPQ